MLVDVKGRLYAGGRTFRHSSIAGHRDQLCVSTGGFRNERLAGCCFIHPQTFTKAPKHLHVCAFDYCINCLCMQTVLHFNGHCMCMSFVHVS